MLAQARMEALARKLGRGLRAPGERDGAPVVVRLPSATARPLRVGHLDRDIGGGPVTADDATRLILGNDPAAPRTMEALTARLLPEDVYGLWTLGSTAARPAEARVSRVSLWAPGDDRSSWRSPATAHRTA